MDANLINFVQIWIIIVYCQLHKVTFNEAIHFFYKTIITTKVLQQKLVLDLIIVVPTITFTIVIFLYAEKEYVLSSKYI